MQYLFFFYWQKQNREEHVCNLFHRIFDEALVRNLALCKIEHFSSWFPLIRTETFLKLYSAQRVSLDQVTIFYDLSASCNFLWLQRNTSQMSYFRQSLSLLLRFWYNKNIKFICRYFILLTCNSQNAEKSMTKLHRHRQ